MRRGSAGCFERGLTVRTLWTYGRLLTAFALVLLVLVGTRLMESQTLAGEEGALIAIQTATVHAAEHPQSTFDVQLPVRSHRDRRELVELRALSTFELDRLPGDSPWML